VALGKQIYEIFKKGSIECFSDRNFIKCKGTEEHPLFCSVVAMAKYNNRRLRNRNSIHVFNLQIVYFCGN